MLEVSVFGIKFKFSFLVFAVFTRLSTLFELGESAAEAAFELLFSDASCELCADELSPRFELILRFELVLLSDLVELFSLFISSESLFCTAVKNVCVSAETKVW